MDEAVEFTEDEWRLFQAQHDIQEALSALTFFMDVPDAMGEIERRRFRCYHDSMAVSYWRPFCQSRGLQTLSFRTIGIKPTANEKKLHHRLKDYRNKIVAHTDSDRMRILVKAIGVGDEEDSPRLPMMAMDKGFEFLHDQRELENWFRKLRGALSKITFDIAQRLPRDGSTKIDYLDQGQS